MKPSFGMLPGIPSRCFDTRNRWAAKVALDSEGEGQTRRIASDLLLSQPRCASLSDGDICDNIQTDLSARQRVALARQLRALKSDWKKKGSKRIEPADRIRRGNLPWEKSCCAAPSRR